MKSNHWKRMEIAAFESIAQRIELYLLVDQEVFLTELVNSGWDRKDAVKEYLYLQEEYRDVKKGVQKGMGL